MLESMMVILYLWLIPCIIDILYAKYICKDSVDAEFIADLFFIPAMNLVLIPVVVFKDINLLDGLRSWILEDKE